MSEQMAALYAAMVKQGEATAPPLPTPAKLPTRAELIARYGPPTIKSESFVAWWLPSSSPGKRYIALDECTGSFRDEVREEPTLP